MPVALSCSHFLAETSQRAQIVVTQDAVDYADMEMRLVLRGYLVAEIRSAYADLAVAFSRSQHRIEDPFCAGYYLRGAVLSAESPRDLVRASSLLGGEEIALSYQAARLAWFARKFDQCRHEYPEHDPRAGATAELARFDDGVPRVRRFSYDRLTGAVQPAPLEKKTLDRMRALGLNVPQQPVGRFRFNDGWAFEFLEHPWFMLWSAQALARQLPDEILLGYDDPSVRMFFPYFLLNRNGHLMRTPPAADFLSLKDGKFFVRELKFSKATADVDVSHALDQLRSTVRGLNARFPDVPIAVLEIVVPRRGGNAAGTVIPLDHVIPTEHGPVRVGMRMLPDPP